MIVAITGGTGFIGSVLAKRHLDNGDQVRIISRRSHEQWPQSSSYTWIKSDLASGGILASLLEGVDVLYHAAGQLTDEESMRALHVEGTRNLVEAAAKSGIGHWVQLSSVGVYGAVSAGSVTEASPINPDGEYEITKAESDQIVLDAAVRGIFSCSILRPTNVFGVDMNNQSLFSMINMIDRGLFFFIGKPGASANYIHVDNVVEGLVLCGTMPEARGKIYNLSDCCPMEKFVQTISDGLERKLPTVRVPEFPVRLIAKAVGLIPGFPLTQKRVDALTNRSNYPIDQIQNDLGYSHIISMENGLQQLVAAYKSKQ